MSNRALTELKPGVDGYAPSPQAPSAAADKRRKVDRMCMKASSLQVVSDGTLAGTVVIVDGVQIGGLVRFELIAQKGYKRVTAVVDMNYDKEDDQQLHAELAGTPVCGDDGKPLTITVDVFRRA